MEAGSLYRGEIDKEAWTETEEKRTTKPVEKKMLNALSEIEKSIKNIEQIMRLFVKILNITITESDDLDGLEELQSLSVEPKH